MSDNKDKPKFHPLGSFNKKPKNSKSEPKNNAQFYKTEERCSESNVIERSIRNSDASIIEAENSAQSPKKIIIHYNFMYLM